MIEINEKMYDEIARMSSTYGLGGCTDINGFISRDGVPDLLHRASVVLLLAGETKENGPHGIMTTKFFEALGVEKPILCVRNDGGCLAASGGGGAYHRGRSRPRKARASLLFGSGLCLGSVGI